MIYKIYLVVKNEKYETPLKNKEERNDKMQMDNMRLTPYEETYSDSQKKANVVDNIVGKGVGFFKKVAGLLNVEQETTSPNLKLQTQHSNEKPVANPNPAFYYDQTLKRWVIPGHPQDEEDEEPLKKEENNNNKIVSPIKPKVAVIPPPSIIQKIEKHNSTHSEKKDNTNITNNEEIKARSEAKISNPFNVKVSSQPAHQQKKPHFQNRYANPFANN